MTVGDRIRMERKKAGLTQEELAQKIGTTKQTINKYEDGTVSNGIPICKIELLAKALLTNPAYLMGWTEDSSITISGNNNAVNNSTVNVSAEQSVIGKLFDELDAENQYKLLSYGFQLLAAQKK